MRAGSRKAAQSAPFTVLDPPRPGRGQAWGVALLAVVDQVQAHQVVPDQPAVHAHRSVHRARRLGQRHVLPVGLAGRGVAPGRAVAHVMALAARDGEVQALDRRTRRRRGVCVRPAVLRWPSAPKRYP